MNRIDESVGRHDWIRHAMWWHVYPLGFVGAPIRPDHRDGVVHHRLASLEHWLDHIVELGLNGIQLGPIFASASHGYDTLDHYAIDDRLGDEADFTHLVEAARAKGVRVLLDGVFNHVGRAHPWFADVEQNGLRSPYANLFRIDWAGWNAGDPIRADVFEGHDGLVALDHDSPRTADLVVDVMSHWLQRGADGWRLDAAYAVPPEFWAHVLPRVREIHPEAWFTGEVIHFASAELVEVSTMDSLTQYELWQAIWHAIADRNLYELSHALGRHNQLLPTYVPSTFIGNHDVTRIRSAVGAAHVGHALAVLLTVAGVPSLYAGDEFGLQAIKEQRWGGDDAIRPAFPASPPREADLDDEAADILRTHRQLLHVRRTHPWLHHAHSDIIAVTNETLVLRSATESAGLVTALNLSTSAQRLPAGGASTLLAGTATRHHAHIIVPANSWAVLDADPMSGASRLGTAAR